MFATKPNQENDPRQEVVFEMLVNEFQVRIFRYALSIVNDVELARDVTQDTFLAAYSSLIKRDGEAVQEVMQKLQAWLYTIARNRAISELRKRKHSRSFSFWQSQNVAANNSKESDITDWFSGLQANTNLETQVLVSDELEQALKKFDQKQLTPFLLHTEGYSYKEICLLTNENLPTVKSKIFRSRQGLRKVLAAS